MKAGARDRREHEYAEQARAVLVALSLAIAHAEGPVTRHAACFGVPEEHDKSAFAKTLNERHAVRFLHANRGGE